MTGCYSDYETKFVTRTRGKKANCDVTKTPLVNILKVLNMENKAILD